VFDGRSSASVGSSILYDSHDISIGADVDSGTATALLIGDLDELAIYDRALTSEEIRRLASI
jgi:hypothetical protein